MKQNLDSMRGKLVILTAHLERWYKELNSNFNVPLQNRLGKLIKVFDWNTPEGKLVLEERKKLEGKWKNLEPKDFRFVVKIYYPELILKDNSQVSIPEVIPQYYPGTKFPMFIMVPEWMVEDMIKEEKDIFKVEKKD